MEHFDVIVVGSGGIGSAAAAHLARRGARVLAVDRFPLAHARGSSHGHTRLIRLAYFEHPDYVPLLRRAYALWRDLEAAVGETLLVESGLVIAGPPGSKVLAGIDRSAAEHGLAVERLGAEAVAARWPALAIAHDWSARYEACGGFLFVERCVAAHAAVAIRSGASFRHGITVHGWEATSHGVTLVTDCGTFAADRLVLAPGPWAAGLLRLPHLRLQVLRKSLFWYEPPAADCPLFAAGSLPCFACDTPDGFFYGFPQLDQRGVKLAEHTGGPEVSDPLMVDRGIDAAEQARIEAFTATHLPRLGTSRAAHAACLYTMTDDHHFIVGLHPDSDRVAVAAGFSGHGFKFASVLGEILADLASGGTPQPIGFLSPCRFG
jgi:sarcosine oxidase